MYQFTPKPKQEDFQELAAYLASSRPEKLHPALWPQRVSVAKSLRRLSRESEKQTARSAYHAMRLFVW